MPRVDTTFGGGGNVNSVLDREGLDIGAAPDFWGDLNKMSQIMRPARSTMTSPAQGRALSRTPAYRSGTGPMSRRTPGPDFSGGTGSDGGSHSFVRNMWGANQVGGYVPSGFGGGAVYGGYDPTGGAGGRINVDSAVPERQRAFLQEAPVDPGIRAQLANLSLGPSLAERQRDERTEAAGRSSQPYSFENPANSASAPARQRQSQSPTKRSPGPHRDSYQF